MKFSNMQKLAITVAATALALGCSNLAQAETPSWCGPKKATIALLDGYGGNSWRQVTTASGKEEALKCPSITKYEYADGQGDTQKSISDIKAMAAKGVDALVVFPDAGQAMLPAITAVYKSGKVIVPYRVEAGGQAGVNYTKFIGTDFVNDGKNWGEWIKSVLPQGGNLLFVSGPAGNSQGLDELKGLKSVLGSEYKFLNPEPFDVTNWDPALTQKVLTAEIAKNPKIDVIVSISDPRWSARFRCSSSPADRSRRSPRRTAIRSAACGPTSMRTTRTSSSSPSRPKTTTFASRCSGRSQQ
jgi:ribose transport system substrate-binding protein